GYGQSRNYRARRAERGVEEMAILQERHQANTFFFVDEALAPRTLGALSDEIVRQGLELRWGGCARFEEQLDAPLLRRVAEAGGRMLMFGLESGAQAVLDRLHKGTDLRTISRVLRQSAAAGIWNHVFVFFGFPGETWADAEATMRFVMGHLDAIHSIAGGTFVLEKYADVCENYRDYGVARIVSDPEADLAFQYAYHVSEGQSAAQAAESLRCFTDLLDAQRQPQVFFYDVYNLLYSSHYSDWERLWSSMPGDRSPVGSIAVP
ncbi:MAG: radical SAM protein, partial [Anaerolineae bacterium]|nr:radical SAM protein [Anaerolineae bacterium]